MDLGAIDAVMSFLTNCMLRQVAATSMRCTPLLTINLFTNISQSHVNIVEAKNFSFLSHVNIIQLHMDWHNCGS